MVRKLIIAEICGERIMLTLPWPGSKEQRGSVWGSSIPFKGMPQ
jgi:hypothetical protein